MKRVLEKMRIFKADLHIHSCLSPCAELGISPRAIVEKSLSKGLDIIAICDHNSAENVGAAIRVGKKKGIYVIPGLEICSKEEVHILALFGREEDALKMQEIVYQNLKGTNRPEIFGDQIIANENDEIEGFNEKLLIGAVQLDIYDIEKLIHDLHGICIFAHVDRPSFSIISQLGFIPEGFNADAIEVTSSFINKEIEDLIRGYPVIYSSDAHFLKDIGKRYTNFLLNDPNFDEVYMALKGANGRKII